MWIFSLLSACSTDEATVPSDPTTVVPDTVPTPTVEPTTPEPDDYQAAAEAFYEPSRVVRIEIEIDDADAAALGAQTNDIFALLEGEDCMEAPWKGPFTWFPADVTIDGTLVAQVGVRKKGLIGSMSTDKPSLKIELDEYVDGQEYEGIEHITLNNAVSDPTLVRQCLGYDLFAEAGLPAPRCNFAEVHVNGESLGVYVNVEPPKPGLLRHRFGDDEGDLYEGTLSDFRDGWTQTFEPDTDETDATLAPIHAVTAALEIVDDGSMLAAVGDLVDLPSFYRFWAMETLIAHLDGYAGNTNNFYVYFRDDTDKAEFVPWGIDSTFFHFDAFGSSAELVVLANSQLTRRLWESDEGQAGFRAAMEDLLATVWDAEVLVAEVDRMTTLVEPYALPDPYRATYQDELRAFLETREAEMQGLLAAPAPVFDAPLSEPYCLLPVGDLRVEFSTTWGSLESIDPFTTGASWIDAEVDGAPLDFVGGAVAGDEYGYTLIAAVAWTGPTSIVQVAGYVPSYLLAVGETPIDGFFVPVYLLEMDFAVEEEARVLGAIYNGTLVLTAYDPVVGGEITGWFEGDLYSSGMF